MNSQDFEKALVDVAKVFGSPEEIGRRDDLTRAQKLKLLQQWDYDLRLLLVASEENMPSAEAKSDMGRTGTSGSSADLVQRIHNVLTRMGAEADPEKSGPAKSGGVEMPGADAAGSPRNPAKKARTAS